jgi:hypothetical protein
MAEDVIMKFAKAWFVDVHVTEIIDQLPREVIRRAAIGQARVLLEVAIENRKLWEDGHENSKRYWEEMVESVNSAYAILSALEDEK